MMIDDKSYQMITYGRTENGKWHVMSGKQAKCSKIINITQREYFLSEPKEMCERCVKRKVQLRVVEVKNNNGTAPMDIEPDEFFQKKKVTRKNIPKTLSDALWNKEYGAHSGTGNCVVCQRIINSTTFKCGYIISTSNEGGTYLENLKCLCYYCHKLQGNQNLREYANNFFNGIYKNKSIKKSIPKHTKIALWNGTHGSHKREAECYVCLRIITSTTFQAGHVIPESKGGTNDIGNLKCICTKCNLSMGNKHLEEFKNKHFPKKINLNTPFGNSFYTSVGNLNFNNGF